MNAYAKMLKNAFNFHGRTTRRDFWIPFFINGALTLFLYGLVFLASTVAGDGLYIVTSNRVSVSTVDSRIATIFCIPWFIIFLYTFIIQMGLTVRRLHDAGIPGWVYPICLVTSCILCIGWIVKVILCCLDSKPDNQWGPNPKMQKTAGMPQMNGMPQENALSWNGAGNVNNVYEFPAQPSNVPVAVSGAVYAMALIFAGATMVANYNLSMDQGNRQVQENQLKDTLSDIFEGTEGQDSWNLDDDDTKTDMETDINDDTDENNETAENNGGTYRIYLDDNQTMEAQIPDYPGFKVTDYDEGYYVSMEAENSELWESGSVYETKEEALEALNSDSPFDRDYLTLVEDECVAAGETTVNGNAVYYNKCVDISGDDTEREYHMYVDLGMQYLLEIRLTSRQDITDEDAFAMASFK